MHGTLEQSIGPEMHQIPNVDEDRWEWVVLCARWIYVHGRPERIWSKDLEAWLGGALEKESEGTWTVGNENLLSRSLEHWRLP